MENVTFEEMSLMCIYNSSGTREGLIDALTEMRGDLGPDETELLALTDSSIEKLTAMSDDEYEASGSPYSPLSELICLRMIFITDTRKLYNDIP